MEHRSAFDLSGKVAIITGSSRGIGRAIAEAMADHGASVVISSRKQEACDAVAAELADTYGEERVLAHAASISSKEALEGLVDRTIDRLGRIDIVVCNAASNPYYGPISGIDDERFRKILDNNILSNHWLIQLALPGMIERREGSIIIVSSITGLVGSRTIGAYGVSKAADLQLVRNLAVELGEHGVRANCIAPGLVRTDFARALWENPAAEAKVNRLTPLGRLGEPAEIAGAAVFLAAPASAFMTGQSIVIDGGMTIADALG